MDAQVLRRFPRVRRWLARRALARASTQPIELSSLTAIPEETQYPLQRVGTEPVAQLAEVRAQGSLTRLELPFGFTAYLVTGYGEALDTLKDTGRFSNDIRHLVHSSAPEDSIGGLGFTDPPEHTRLRKLITPEFTRRRLARLDPIIRGIVAGRLDALEAAGSGSDLAQLFAFPVPFQTICGLLGMSTADQDAFQELGSARFDATNGAAAAFGAMTEQRRFLFETVASQRRDPGPGLIGQLIRDHGDEISDEALAGLCDGVFTGGYETTAGMIALSVIVLLRDPALANRMREGDQDDVDALIDELLRYLTVVQMAFPRFVKTDMTLFGRQLKAGDVILTSLSGANRDPASAGPNPDAFDPDRKAPSAHIAFGYGAHRCIGAELARMELRIALPELFRRFPDLALDVSEDQVRFRNLSFVFGVEELTVRF